MTNQTNENLEYQVNSTAAIGKFIVSREGSTYIFDAMDNPGRLEHKDIARKYARSKVIGGGKIDAGIEKYVGPQPFGYVHMSDRSTEYGQVPLDVLKEFGRSLKEKYESEFKLSVTEIFYRSPSFEKTDLLKEEGRENL